MTASSLPLTHRSLSPLPTVPKDARVAVLCGGLSQEREVSLRSGQNCMEALHRLGYGLAHLIDVGHDIAEQLKQHQTEVVFLTLHGRYGEDGAIQGLLELMGIPYTGNRLMASALTMDKDVTKRLLKAAGLPVIPWVTLRNLPDQSVDTLHQLTQCLQYPLMVKPVSEGSSIGMAKVEKSEQLFHAVTQAWQYDSKVMVEEFRPGLSITVGVFDQGGIPTVTPILALKTKTDWYDFEAKYTEGLTEFVVPAELPESTTLAIQEMTLQVHQVMGCYGVSRTDYVVTEEGAFYILEVNTIPGMTALSDLPAQAKAMGISYDELVDHLLQTAVRYPFPSQHASQQSEEALM